VQETVKLQRISRFVDGIAYPNLLPSPIALSGIIWYIE
jgi:hypothetical protein